MAANPVFIKQRGLIIIFFKATRPTAMKLKLGIHLPTYENSLNSSRQSDQKSKVGARPVFLNQ